MQTQLEKPCEVSMISVGDRVAVRWGDLRNSNTSEWMATLLAGMDSPKGEFYKTQITRIQTHKWLGLVELNEPIYFVGYGLIADKFKLLRGASD